jgi:hypothetical protein
MIRADVLLDHPNGGYHRRAGCGTLETVAVEIGVIALTIVCFVILDLYVAGCDRV